MVFPHALVECHICQVSNISGNRMTVCMTKVDQPEVFFKGLKLGDDFVCQGTVETPAEKRISEQDLSSTFMYYIFLLSDNNQKDIELY